MASFSSKHIVFLVLFIGAIGLSLVLLWPFLVILLISAALAVVFYPIHQWFLKYVTRGNGWFAALFTVIIFLVVICGPLFLIGTSVFQQVQSVYVTLAEKTSEPSVIVRFNEMITRYFPWASFQIEEKALSVATVVTERIGDIVSVVISSLFSLFLAVLALFYFLKDGPRWRKTIVSIIPLSSESTHRIIERLSHAINGVMKGYLLIAVIQGIMLGLGLWFFGVPNPALWGVLAGIASLIPTIGTALVSIPAVVFLVSVGATENAIGLGLWAALLVGTVDNLLSPIVVGRRIDIHPMFILFAVLGGIALLGPAGILIGPLTISFLYTLSSVYNIEMQS